MNESAMLSVYSIEALVNDFPSLLPADDSIYDARDHPLLGDGRSQVEGWHPLKTMADGPEADFPDVVGLGAGGLVFKDKARSACEALLGNAVEWLPIIFPDGETGHYLNVTAISNCMDSEQSRWETDPDSGKRLWLIEPHFVSNEIPDSAFFKSHESFTHTFLQSGEGGHKLLELIRAGALSGLQVNLVWQSTRTEEWKPLD